MAMTHSMKIAVFCKKCILMKSVILISILFQGKRQSLTKPLGMQASIFGACPKPG